MLRVLKEKVDVAKSTKRNDNSMYLERLRLEGYFPEKKIPVHPHLELFNNIKREVENDRYYQAIRRDFSSTE